MAQSIVDRRVWSNSASGYVRSVFRLLLGVASFRLLCSELSTEEFGFYSLVWSFLGYGVLLDMGMGVAVKKRTAELLQTKDWNLLGRLLSTVLFCNCLRALLTVAIGFWSTDMLLEAVGVSDVQRASFRHTLRIFVVGMAAMFPLEMFREVHSGQQRIAFADRLSTFGGIVSFILLWCAVRWHWGLSVIFGLQILCLVLVGIVLVFSALRVMPEVRVGIRFVSWSVLRGIAKFSALAYLVAFAGIVMLQADRFLVGTVLSVSAVAVYHIGAKIPELLATFTRQLPDALAPAAAAVHGAGQKNHWQKLFLRGMRLNALLTTPLFLLCSLFLEHFLDLLTRGRVSGSDTVLLGRILLFWTYSTILTHGISKSVFLLCGHESRLVRLLVLEAIANIVLSLILLKWLQNPLGAALGSLFPALFLGWGCLWPWTAREIGITPAKLARETVVPAWVAATPMLLFGIACRQFVVPDVSANILVLSLVVGMTLLVAALGTWLLALTGEERLFLARKITESLRKVGFLRVAPDLE